MREICFHVSQFKHAKAMTISCRPTSGPTLPAPSSTKPQGKRVRFAKEPLSQAEKQQLDSTAQFAFNESSQPTLPVTQKPTWYQQGDV